MKRSPGHELPPAKEAAARRAKRLEWITIGYLISAILLIKLTMGASQAMKTAYYEDMLSLIPPMAYLFASRIRGRPPDEEHPYGWHRSVSIAYLVASTALVTMGAFLIFDSVAALLAFEHPTIGTVSVAGHQVWLGWLMIPAAAYSAFPAMVIGRMKLPLARELHDKVLHADAKMNKADWLTGVAAILGVTGIAFGLWWADALAAGVIAADIFHDGTQNVRTAVQDLMDRAPMHVDGDAKEGLPARVVTEMKKLAWVRDARARMREEGHVFFGEVFVVPVSDEDLTRNVAEATRALHELDWRIHDVVLTPVAHLEDPDSLTPSWER